MRVREGGVDVCVCVGVWPRVAEGGNEGVWAVWVIHWVNVRVGVCGGGRGWSRVSKLRWAVWVMH